MFIRPAKPLNPHTSGRFQIAQDIEQLNQNLTKILESVAKKNQKFPFILLQSLEILKCTTSQYFHFQKKIKPDWVELLEEYVYPLFNRVYLS